MCAGRRVVRLPAFFQRIHNGSKGIKMKKIKEKHLNSYAANVTILINAKSEKEATEIIDAIFAVTLVDRWEGQTPARHQINSVSLGPLKRQMKCQSIELGLLMYPENPAWRCEREGVHVLNINIKRGTRIINDGFLCGDCLNAIRENIYTTENVKQRLGKKL